MARPNQDEIKMYQDITGASESLALERLEEHGGDLNQAVNAFYGTEEATPPINSPIPTSYPMPYGYPMPPHNAVASNNNAGSQPLSRVLKMVSAARAFKPSLLLDSDYRRGLYTRIGAAGSSLLSQRVTAPVPDGDDRHGSVGPGPNYIRTGHIPTGNDSSGLGGEDVDDEVLQFVINDSLTDAQGQAALLHGGRTEREMDQELRDLSHAMSLSMESFENEEAIRQQQMVELEVGGVTEPGSSSNQTEAQTEEEKEKEEEEDPSRFEEWGGISFEKLDESRSLEAAFFGSTSGVKSNNSLSVPPEDSRMIEEEEDMGYCAIPFPGKQKEIKSFQGAVEVGSKRGLGVKGTSLSCEPDPDDENAVTLNVRMPNGNRAGRRFLKSDKLQLLFDFIEIGGEVKPGTYRVVRHFPRRVLNPDESELTLTELDLITKHEVLFVELI